MALGDDNSGKNKQSSAAEAAQAVPGEVLNMLKSRSRHFGMHKSINGLNVLVLFNTIAVILLLMLLVWMVKGASSKPSAATNNNYYPVVTQTKSQPPQAQPAAIEQGPSFSHQSAMALLSSGQHEQALAEFGRLCEQARQIGGKLEADYYSLRKAQCFKALLRDQEQRDSLGLLIDSSSPAVAACALYQMSLLEIEEGQYLRARMRAYGAIAAMGTLSGFETVEANCGLAIGKAMAMKVLPGDFPMACPLPDGPYPFDNLNEAALQNLLKEKFSESSNALLGPVVEAVVSKDEQVRWYLTAVCSPLEEVLSRLVAKTGTPVKFISVSPVARNRPITIRARATESRLVEIVAGMAGLIVRNTGQSLLIIDPHALETVQEQNSCLLDEAMAHWRRLCLQLLNDPKISQARFMLAGLLQASGDSTAAISEFQLIAGQYPTHTHAPLALLQCARLRLSINDFTGARQNLLELLDTYPGCEKGDDAYLALGQATLQARQYQQSLDIFSRLFFLELSPRSRMLACLGAGESLHCLGQHDKACQWLDRYLALALAAKDGQLVRGCLMLASSHQALGNHEQACAVFALAMNNAQSDHVSLCTASLGLVRSQLARQKYGNALRVLGAINKDDFTKDQQSEAIVLEAQALRAMGLAQECIQSLRSKVGDLAPSAQPPIRLEIARGLVQNDQPQQAYEAYMEVLPNLAAPLSFQAIYELAELCLVTERASQAQALCRQLLGSSAPLELKEKVRQTLSQVLVRQKQYDQAVLTLTGQPGKEGGN